MIIRTLLVLGLLCGLTPPTWAATAAKQPPVDAKAITAGMQQAIDSKNATMFKQYINLDAVLTKGMYAAFEETRAYLSSPDIDPVEALLLGAMISAGDVGDNKLVQALQRETEAFVIQGISSGRFAGEENNKKQASGGMFQMIFDDVAPGRKSFSQGQLLSQNATHAKIASTLHDAGTGDQFPLELLLEWNKSEAVWKVNEISNLQEQLRRLHTEHKNR